VIRIFGCDLTGFIEIKTIKYFYHEIKCMAAHCRISILFVLLISLFAIHSANAIINELPAGVIIPSDFISPDYDEPVSEQTDIALEYYNEGNYEAALAAIEKALLISVTYGRAHYVKGLILKNLNRFEEAIEEFGWAVRIDPNDSDSAEFLAELKNRDTKESLSDTAGGVDSPTEESTDNAGNISSVGTSDTSTDISSDQQNGTPASDPTSGHEEILNATESTGYQGENVSTSPRTAQDWVTIGDDFYKQGIYDQVIKAFNRALLIDPDNTVARTGLDAAKSRI
jgi:tetratricopeptide (TPR) repeat protein